MGIVVGILLVWFIIEMLLWYLVAQFISGWWVFFWFVAAAVIGIGMLKKTFNTFNPLAQQMRSGVIPNPANQPSESNMMRALAMGLAGILLLLPGLISDVVALILLLPMVQKRLSVAAKNYAIKNQDKMMAMMAKQMGGNGNPFGMSGGNTFGNSPFGGNPFGGSTIDGEAKSIHKPNKNITSANDD